MNLAEFGVRKPVTNLMIFSGIILLALFSLTRIGIDSMPEIESPSITVITQYPGASPSDVETKVTEELENQLATTPGLEKITSFSSEGASVIQLKFLWGTDLNEASNDIRDRIELAKRFLPDIPDEIENPFIFKFNTSNIPILFVGFTAGPSYNDLYEIVDKQVADSLQQLPGVGTVQIQGGGLERQINVWIDRQRLEGYGFSILDIENAIKASNISQPVGSIKSGLSDYLIRLPGEFAAPGELDTVLLGRSGGKFVYLRDVAQVEDGFKEVTVNVRINENAGVMMMVQKQSGTNTVEVAQRVKKRLAELARTLPSDVKVIQIFDTSSDIITSLTSLRETLQIAIVMVILVTWFFLRGLASSLVVALTIPFSLLISFIYLFLSGRTINTISLSSLAIASGMVVDNAIVVVDNISRRLSMGERRQEAAIFGTGEMITAIAASTLTTVVVFVPMLFIPGVVGIMFSELAVITIVTLAASLFTASTFTPMLASRWFKNAAGGRKRTHTLYEFSERILSALDSGYSSALAWCFRFKWLVVAIVVIVFAAVLPLATKVGNEFIPQEDTGVLRIDASLPIGTRVEVTQEVAKRIEVILKEEAGSEGEYYFVRSGTVQGLGRAFGQTSGPHIIAAGVQLVPKTQRKRSVEEAAQQIRAKIRRIPGIERTNITTGNPIGRLITGTGGKTIQVEILGNSFEDTDAAAAKIKAMVERVPGAVDVTISRELNLPEVQIVVDRQKASVLGLSMNTVASALNTYIQGSTASKYREKGETYDIYVRLNEESRSAFEDLNNLFIVSPLSQEQVKLSTIAQIRETAGPQEIERQNRQRVVRVEANTTGRSSGKIVEDISKQLPGIALPTGVTVRVGGEAEEQQKAFRDLALLFILGVALVYMVMAAQFESLLDPFIIMFSVPVTFVGVILAFLLTGTNLSIITFLGIVMLTGIVVNNAIVLISYLNILRARGYALLDAVREGGRSRLRPILMTTLTTLAGLLPMALSTGEGSEVWKPLGITMIGGLTGSTLITLLFIPTIYAIIESRAKKPKEK